MWTCPNCGREFKRTNQSHFCGSAPETVEAYIATLPEDVRAAMNTLAEAIRAALPGAKECIAWGMPTWKDRGNLIHLAAQKRHIGIYPGDAAVAHFQEALRGFATSKGSIRVKHDQHIDPALVARIAAWCRENQQEEA